MSNPSIFRISTTLFIAVLLTMFTPQQGFAHGNHNNPCTGPHSTDAGCNEPPPPPVTACDTPDFPAFAFSKGIYDGKRGSLSGYSLHLSNSDGSCTVEMLTNDARESLNISYRQSGTSGRIVWSQGTETGLGRKDPDRGRSVVKMVDFEVNAGVISNVEQTTPYMMPPSEGGEALFDIELAPNGEHAYFSYENEFGGSLNELVLGTGARTVLEFTVQHESFNGLGMATNDRIYYTLFGPNVSLHYLDLSTGDDVTVADRSDAGYTLVKFVEVSVITDGLGNDNLAVSFDNLNTIDLMEVSDDCDANTTTTCLSEGTAASTYDKIPGRELSLDSTGLLTDFGGNINIIHNGGTISGGFYPDSAE